MNLFSFIEKRKQLQFYTIYNFLSSSLSYFDFSSFDLVENFQEFSILKAITKSSSFADIIFFLSFFVQKNNYFIHNYLKKFFKTSNKKNLIKKSSKSIFEKIIDNKNSKLSSNDLSKQFKLFYSQSVEKALNKYKSPIITSEIFLLTAINENPFFFKDVLKFFIKNKKQWLIFKYKLTRHIYFGTFSIHSSLTKNLWHYSFLIDKYNYVKKKKNLEKTLFREKEAQKLKIFKTIFGEKKTLTSFSKDNESILVLRSLIFSILLKLNFQNILEDDILLNNKTIFSRKYINKRSKGLITSNI